LRLLLGVTGSAAVLDLPRYIDAIHNAGVSEITAVMTRASEHFLSAQSVSYLVDKVYTDDDWGYGHIAIWEECDSVLVLPATANTLGNVANGLSPDLLSTTLMCGKAAFVPMMHLSMWKSPAVQRNVHRLYEDGHKILYPREGPVYEVAHKKVEQGLTMASMEDIIKEIYK
jgi:phosphopantothenoylcysteine synthetase/decarboxylase